MPLVPPAGFIFGVAVLQIKHRIACGGVLFIIGRRVDETAAPCAGDFGEIQVLAQLPVRHVLQGIKILVPGGNFNRVPHRPAP